MIRVIKKTIRLSEHEKVNTTNELNKVHHNQSFLGDEFGEKSDMQRKMFLKQINKRFISPVDILNNNSIVEVQMRFKKNYGTIWKELNNTLKIYYTLM